MSKSKTTHAPYSSDGSLQHYPSYDCEMREIVQFRARLTLVGLERGRSAAYFWWKDKDTGCTYPMFMKEMVDFLQDGLIVHGETHSRWWTVAKRGQNYGIKAVAE